MGSANMRVKQGLSRRVSGIGSLRVRDMGSRREKEMGLPIQRSLPTAEVSDPVPELAGERTPYERDLSETNPPFDYQNPTSVPYLYDDCMDDYDLASRSFGSSNHRSFCGGGTWSDGQDTETTEFVSLRAPIRSACSKCGVLATKHAKFCSECGSSFVGNNEGSEHELQRSSTWNRSGERKVYTYSVKILYDENNVLGVGSNSTVYKAIDIKSGQPLAVKLQYINLDDEGKVEDIRRELRHLSSLRHPNIVEYMGCSVERGKIYILMERLECGSLQDTIEQFPSGAPQSTVSAYTLQLLRGIEYLHSCGVTHRDIKPANILLSSDGTIKISDFGSATLAIATRSTDEPKLAGTPLYMPPEALDTIGKHGNDMLVYGKAHDIWSLGCCVHQLLTGEKPWSSLDVGNAFALLMQIKRRPFILSEDLSFSARAFLVECLQQDPLQRASASELLTHEFITNPEYGDGSYLNAENEYDAV
ncbi:putative protein kinase [Trypanosoma theileri]|uniref:Protein kinase domain-containing protein n=1 Tax=Trypanosoma theileri TaxID=67003 RepID=A0A1X0NLC8_9TRYP|nr:putative protein kinase [Trypanosoma theileri]ORC85564.1 putative protein kinase [Trypanosoma theileri]